MFEGLEDSGIIEMLAVANQQLEDWKDLTFGIHNGSLDIEGNFDRHTKWMKCADKQDSENSLCQNINLTSNRK